MTAMHVLSDPPLSRPVALDARWTIERVQILPAPGAPSESETVAVGDTVVLRVRSGAGLRSTTDWHPPSRVVGARTSADGTVTLDVLCDQSLELLETRDVRRLDPSLARRPPLGPVRRDQMKRRLRNLWGLDVWCPTCGAEGHPVIVGMPDPEIVEPRDHQGVLQPWPAGSVALHGCVITDEPIPGYICPRCGASWGHRNWL